MFVGSRVSSWLWIQHLGPSALSWDPDWRPGWSPSPEPWAMSEHHPPRAESLPPRCNLVWMEVSENGDTAKNHGFQYLKSSDFGWLGVAYFRTPPNSQVFWGLVLLSSSKISVKWMILPPNMIVGFDPFPCVIFVSHLLGWKTIGWCQVQRMPRAMFISHRSGRSLAGGPKGAMGQPPGPTCWDGGGQHFWGGQGMYMDVPPIWW